MHPNTLFWDTRETLEKNLKSLNMLQNGRINQNTTNGRAVPEEKKRQ
jgi:hypothetical protein